MSEFLYSISPSTWNHFLLSLGRWLSAVSNPFHCEENISQLLSVPVKTDQSCLVFFCSLDPITMTKMVWHNKFEHGPIPRMRQSPIILDPLGLPDLNQGFPKDRMLCTYAYGYEKNIKGFSFSPTI